MEKTKTETDGVDCSDLQALNRPTVGKDITEGDRVLLDADGMIHKVV